MVNEVDCVELGMACADVCIALDRGTNGKRLDELNDSACEAIKQLTTCVTSGDAPLEYLTDDPIDRPQDGGRDPKENCQAG